MEHINKMTHYAQEQIKKTEETPLKLGHDEIFLENVFDQGRW